MRIFLTHVGSFDCLANQNTYQGAADGRTRTPQYLGSQGPCAGLALQGAPALQGLPQQFLRPFWCLDQLEPAEVSGGRPQRQTGTGVGLPIGARATVLPGTRRRQTLRGMIPSPAPTRARFQPGGLVSGPLR